MLYDVVGAFSWTRRRRTGRRFLPSRGGPAARGDSRRIVLACRAGRACVLVLRSEYSGADRSLTPSRPPAPGVSTMRLMALSRPLGAIALTTALLAPAFAQDEFIPRAQDKPPGPAL